MNVNGIGSNASPFIGPGKIGHNINNKEDAQAKNTPETQPLSTESEQQQKGVISLLQEGHFKGVANVRLRINFFDEMSGIASTKTESVTEDKVDNILESVRDATVSYPDTGQLTEEQIGDALETFEQAVNQTKMDFFAGDDQSEDTLVSGLNSAFDTLISSLSVTQQADPADEGDEENTDNPGEPDDAVAAFIVDLTSVFQTALDELIGGISQSKSLPDLSPPNGNGVAYEKFLAIYNELLGNDTAEETSTDVEEIDMIA